jgi:hypothetical protein
LFDIPISETIHPRPGLELTRQTGPLRPIVDWLTLQLQQLGAEIAAKHSPTLSPSARLLKIAKEAKGDTAELGRILKESGFRALAEPKVQHRLVQYLKRLSN